MTRRRSPFGRTLFLTMAVGSLAVASCTGPGGGPPVIEPSEEAPPVEQTTIEHVRAPEAPFAGLAGYPFAPHYVDVGDGLRMHYLDEGPRDAAPIVLMHGLPTWSYLYRNMVGPLTAAGHRVVVPDLIGFGRSDKPVRTEDYTYDRHVAWLTALFDELELRDVTLVAHDFGGMVGLRVAAERVERMRRFVVFNTSLNTGDEVFPTYYLPLFERWKQFMLTAPSLPLGALVDGQTQTTLAPEAVAAYQAPYPDDRHLAGVRVNDTLYPITADAPGADANRRAQDILRRSGRPVFIAFSADAEVLHPGMHDVFRRVFPPSTVWKDIDVAGTKHFLQEDKPVELAGMIDEFVRAK